MSRENYEQINKRGSTLKSQPGGLALKKQSDNGKPVSGQNSASNAIDVDSLGEGADAVLTGPTACTVADDPLPHDAVINTFGCLKDVAAGGNCGYLALMWGLHNRLMLEPSWSVDEFRKSLKHHALENEERLFGMTFYRCSQRKRNDEEQLEFEKRLWRDSIDKIWKEGESYRKGAAVKSWLDGAKHFPIIADRFQVNIVVYGLNQIQPYTATYKLNREGESQGGDIVREIHYNNLRHPAGDGLDKTRTVYLVLSESHYQQLSVTENN